MNTTSSQLPICVHCGTPRPADETLCPTCGKPWIDTTIPTTPSPDAAPPPVAAKSEEAPDSESEDDGPPAGAAAAAAAAAAGAAAAVAATDDDDSGEAHTGSGDADATDGDESETTDDAGPVDGDEADQADKASDEPDGIPVVVPPPPTPTGLEDTGEFSFDAWTQPTEAESESDRRGRAWLVPAGIGVAILAALAFLVFGGGNTSTTTVAADTTTTASTSTTTTQATTTTTTQATTTTVIAFPPPSDWPPKGDPIDTADLTLKQSAIGPIDIGMPIADVAGALTASLGEATASGIDGLCPPDESYWLRFGQLTAIFDGFESSSVFVSYRYDEPEGTDSELGLRTPSGIGIGDTVEDLINTYTQFTISFEIIDSKDYFRLSDGGELLLWGPVSSVDPAGLIEGIYSPTQCDTTP